MNIGALLAVLVIGNVSAHEFFQDKVLESELFKQFNVQSNMDNWIDTLNNRLAQCAYPSDFKGSDSNFLFAAYPLLQNTIPYIALAQVPTPVVKLENLSQRYGTQIYMKNDAVSGGIDGDGMPVYGGNKVRKLGFLFGIAKALGARKVLTFGCVGSNHAVATAVHADALGMYSICMLKHQPPSPVVQHNLLMHLYYGSELHYSANNDIRALNALIVWLDHYKKDGQVPYIIPTGGSNVQGTLGFVDAAFELADQIRQGLVPEPTHIYVPCGSCATAAGLLLGCKAAGIKAHIVAVAVEPDVNRLFVHVIDKLFKQANTLLHEHDSSFPLLAYTDADLSLEYGFAGPNYGIFTAEGSHAAAVILDSEGIVLEGTYTAKALAALLHDVTENPDAKILFWNTYSGLNFSKQVKSQNYRHLPHCFHDYFQADNVQQ
jgi:1-aminocyclopropane-1-carboxylate deaminase/D-cysteine desulfhydrase-like pyridoxal-dependent ACC family enzyme